MDERDHMVRIRCDDSRRLAAALVNEPVTTSIRLAADGRFVAETNDVRQFSRLVPEVARREGIRLFEMQPVDESLASVFSYLVGK
jgi:ABC-2 type transport system ATP-binding protein